MRPGNLPLYTLQHAYDPGTLIRRRGLKQGTENADRAIIHKWEN